MKQSQQIVLKIFDIETLTRQLRIWNFFDKKIVFTNGVFDIFHRGHISLLSEAASLADILIVGVNADASVKRLKGNDRPVNDEHSRALLLASLMMVDAVIIFTEDTPLELIKIIKPNVLVKGGDYKIENIVGAKEVMENGGEVKIVNIVDGFSTTSILKNLKNNNQ